MALLDYLRTLNQFKKQITQSESEKTRTFYSSHSIREDITELENTERSLRITCGNDKNSLFSSIFKLKTQISTVTSKIQDFIRETQAKGVSPNYDTLLSNLQRATDSVGTEITLFKKACKEQYEALQDEEKSLTQEVSQLSDKFEQWGKEAPHSTKPTKLLIQGKEASPLQRAIMSIDTEIAEMGGLTLGWDPLDHQEFLKLRTHHKGKLTPGLVHSLKNVLPHKVEQETHQHFDDHEKFLILQEKKKIILKQWKQEKNNKKNPVSSEENSIETQLKRPSSTLENKRKLEEWKKLKEKTKIEEEKKAAETLSKDRGNEARKRTEIDLKKQLVSEYRERKEILKTHEKLALQANEYKVPSQDIERIKEREDKMVEKRRKRLEESLLREETAARKALLDNLRKQARWSHLDNRLTQETKSTVLRKEAQEKQNTAQTFGGDLLHMSRRATPSWRAGLC